MKPAWPQGASGGPATSTNEGVYSAAQAERGQVLFRDVCIICHPDPFWRASWQGRPVSDIFDTIAKLMPDDAPGTLSAEEVAAALAYILQSNGFPAGPTALPTSSQALTRLRFAEPPK